MWHGPTGHWVINDTPGQHGDDRMMSVLGDFQCPFDIDEWEGTANWTKRRITNSFKVLLLLMISF
jgi:hypothetical protein